MSIIENLKWNRDHSHKEDKWYWLCDNAINEIERLRAALRTIDNMIPKNDPQYPALALVAGDVAEGALNGTWPAFGVMPVHSKEK